MYMNGLWNIPLLPAILVLLEVVATTVQALAIQVLTVAAAIRLTAATVLVLGHHFFLTSSLDHWFNQPERIK